MNNIDEEALKKEILKRVTIQQDKVVIRCSLCESLFNDDRKRFLKELGLPNEEFCKKMNEDLIQHIFNKLMQKKTG
jgi:hypothetical protein